MKTGPSVHIPVRPVPHSLQAGGIAHPLDDFFHVRKVLLKRDVVDPRTDDSRVLTGKENHRRPKRNRLEDPRRNHIHPHIALELIQNRAMYLLEICAGILRQVHPDATLDGVVEVGDAGPTLRPENRPTGREKVRPGLTVNAVTLGPCDVTAQSILLRSRQNALGYPHFVLPQSPYPVGQLTASVADVERSLVERSNRQTDQALWDIAG